MLLVYCIFLFQLSTVHAILKNVLCDREVPELASESVEEYIEAIYRLGGASGTVNTCELADALHVAPASVTTMLRRMSRDGLVKHLRYRGVSLTENGLEMATSTLRRHRLSERLLTDVLGMPWDKVHDAACKLEHVLTGEVEERAFQVCGEPKRCPHGNLLEGQEDQSLILLSDVAAGDRVGVVKLGDENPDFLHLVSELGLIPSTELTVNSRSEAHVTVAISGQEHLVDAALAARIWVQPLTSTEV